MIKHFCDCCGREIDTVVGIDRYTISIPDGTEKEYAKGEKEPKPADGGKEKGNNGQWMFLHVIERNTNFVSTA